MDERLREEFRRFWEKFFAERPGFTQTEFAGLIGEGTDVVAQWVHANDGISLENVSKLLEIDGLLQRKEAAQLFNLCLRNAGFSETSFLHITAACADSSYWLQGGTGRELPILALSPLIQANRSFYTRILQVLAEAAGERKKRVINRPIPDINAKRSLHDYYPKLQQVSGVVAIACHVEGSKWLEECEAAGIPIVLIHDNIHPQKLLRKKGKISAIWEELDGLYELVAHLIRDHDCTQLRIVIADPKNHSRRQAKIDAIRATARMSQVDVDEHKHIYTIKHYTYNEGAKVAEQIIRSDVEAEAVICLSDEVAHGVWETAKLSGLENLKVTGYDNTPLAKHFGITSINLRRGSRARLAFEEIEMSTSNGEIRPYPRICYVKTKLAPLRASCGCR